MSVKAFALALLLPTAGLSQGFAGLGSDASGFAIPDPETRLAFPADHAAHPGFRIEWWYLTANLKDAEGRDYGLQWTLFRSALQAGNDAPVAWMGHAAVTSDTWHYSAERFARSGIGQAGVQAVPFGAWIDDWELQPKEGGSLSARGLEFAYDLQIERPGPIVLQGEGGFSIKAPTGQASHYYSMPFVTVAGTITLADTIIDIRGNAWLDREWSSQPLASDQSGWDWVSLHLDNGEKVMGFRLRSDAGAQFHVANWIGADGKPTPLPANSIEMEPIQVSEVKGRSVPTSWRVRLAERGLDVTLNALNPQSWMDTTFAYWEGPVRVSGSHSGTGYLEMTGYE